MPPIPAIWPTPKNPATRVRVFRVEIDRPLNAGPSVAFHMAEAIEVGTTSFEQHRPEFSPRAALADLLADPELGDLTAQVAAGLEQIAYVLYERKKAELEAPPPPDPVPEVIPDLTLNGQPEQQVPQSISTPVAVSKASIANPSKKTIWASIKGFFGGTK